MTDQSPLLFALNLGAAAGLLIWAVRLVRTGFERAFGSRLRLWLRRSTSNVAKAVASGTLIAVLLQSSTAVAVLMAGFVSSGSIASGAGLGIILGADLGSAVVVLLLNSRVEWMMPVLLLAGVLIFLRSSRRAIRQIGRIFIGLALIFISLDFISNASQPLASSSAVSVAMVYLANQPFTALLLAAAFTWLVHSSVATVLLVATLFAQGILPLQTAFALVLGANLGGCFIALGLTLQSDISVRRIVWMNTALRGGGAIVVLFILMQDLNLSAWMSSLQIPPPLALHLFFNGALVLVAFPFVGPLIRLAEMIMPDSKAAHIAQQRATTLDPAVQNQPSRAFACVERELIQTGNSIEAMLRSIIGLFEHYDEAVVQSIREQFKQIEETTLETKIYLTGITGRQSEDDVDTRAFDLSGIAVSLEAGADTIANKMVKLAKKKHMEQLTFSKDGSRELADFHDLVLRNVQHAISVLMSDDIGIARELIEQKEKVREVTATLERKHLERIRKGQADSIETSAIHLDFLRSLKTLNTSFAVIAHPPLREAGGLLKSRLSTSNE